MKLNKKELEVIRSLTDYRINALKEYAEEQEKVLEYCEKRLKAFPNSKGVKNHHQGVAKTLSRYLTEIVILTELRNKIILMKEEARHEKQ